MPTLNYKHLFYFWTVAREGSIARACETLHVTQPAISAQLRTLERSLGEKLFAKSGRNLVLTDAGQVAFRYADEIFALGREMTDTLRGRPTGRPMRLSVGISDSLPKLLAHRLLEPAFLLEEPVQLVLYEDRPDRLLAELSIHGLDLVMTDAPLPPGVKVRAYNHLLGESGVSIFGTRELIAAHGDEFPAALDGAPFLLPTDNTTLRHSLDQWFEAHGVHPRIVAEIEDSALLKVFGHSGAGFFAAPSVVEGEIERQYQVERVGRVDTIRERFFAISIERRLKHPAVLAITQSARSRLFGTTPS